MPRWLISIVLNLVLKFGIPKLLEWLKERWGLRVSEEVITVLSDYEKDMKEAKISKREAKKRAKERLRHCVGTACPTDLKKD